MADITFSRSTAPTGSVTIQAPSYGAKDPLEFLQPLDYSVGDVPYSYDKGINRNTFELPFTDMPDADYLLMKAFFENVTNGKRYTFTYTDYNGTAHANCLLLTTKIDWPLGQYGRSGDLEIRKQ